MKLTIEQKTLSAAIDKIAGIVEKRNTIPILSNVLIETGGPNSAIIRATDLDIEATTMVECQVEMQGACTVQADLLSGIVKKFKKGPLIAFDATGKTATISQGQAKFDLGMLPAEDFPRLAGDKYEAEFTIQASEASRLLGKTAFAMSAEETRYYLNGVYLHQSDDGITAVSTDGHKLAKAWVKSDAQFTGVIVPRKTVVEVRKVFGIGDVRIAVSPTKIRFDCGDTAIVSKVVDGTFPDYTRVIPKANPDSFRVDAKEFAAATSLVAMVSDDRNVKGVKIAIGSDGLHLSVMGSINSAEDAVPAIVTGGSATINFNANYLASVMAQADGGDIDFAYDAANPMAPALVTVTDDPAFLAVVMPLRG